VCGVVRLVVLRTAMRWGTLKFGGCGVARRRAAAARQRERPISLTCFSAVSAHPYPIQQQITAHSEEWKKEYELKSSCI
jgi:hypothetical protein